ncbi:MAG: 2-amino-4-hydroxy-6-hydroxymethyldihydropteridine diphosphokinase [Gammaproteobacteria bacterium]
MSRRRAVVGIGSNDHPRERIAAGLAALNARWGPLDVSRVYRSRDTGGGELSYLNLAVAFDCIEEWDTLRAGLKSIERDCGRERGRGDGRVALDLDLLILTDAGDGEDAYDLTVEEMRDAVHVLVTAAEVAADWVHPAAGDSLAGLLSRAGDAVASLEAVPSIDPSTAARNAATRQEPRS